MNVQRQKNQENVSNFVKNVASMIKQKHTELNQGIHFSGISCGSKQSFLIVNGGKLLAFGKDEHGRLGLGTNWSETSFIQTPTAVAYFAKVKIVGVASGHSHTLA